MADLKTVVFLFTDMEQSTRLWEEEEPAMQSVLARHDEILRTAISSHDGTVFSTAGDGLGASFVSVRSAVDAALEAQAVLTQERWPIPKAVRVRMGLHLGEAQARDSDWFGSAVNRAARIMSVAHGGQIVVSNAVCEAVRGLLPTGARLVDLGVHRLRDVARDQRLWQLVAPGLPEVFPPLRSMGAWMSGLPAQLTSFVGRDTEVETLIRLLDAARLVTLTGPGGVGKTRLAIETALQASDMYPDGLWFIEMASLGDPAGLDDLVGTAMGLAAAGSRRQTIVEAIGSRLVLLILDNAEHLLDAVGDLTTSLLQRCGGLRVIVTSREPLGVLGEHVWSVRSLAAGHAATLFFDRASAVRPDVVANDVMVERICARLDGIPMAIELAAARTRSLSVSEISDRLADMFAVLTLGRRGTLERHQTMRATIDWSYQLLHDDERTLFNRLAVFAGGFDTSAVETVAGFPPVAVGEIGDLLDQLATKSMIVADIHEETTRYRMLESLRQFASEQLRSEAMEVAGRHAAYYTGLVEHRGSWAMVDEVNAECVVTEFDNLRAAFTHARATGDIDTVLRLTTALHPLWATYDYAEAGVWVGAAADLDGADRHRLSSTAHGQAAYAASFRGDAAARHHHLACGGESPWEALARAIYGSDLERRLADARRGLALALAHAEPTSPTADLDLTIVVVSASLGDVDGDALDRLHRLAEDGSALALLVLGIAEASIAINLGTEDDALAAYDALLAQDERFKRRTHVRYLAPIPRFLLLFRRDRLAALRDARAYLIEARKIGARTWLQCALGRIAVMLAAVGHEHSAAVLQAFTREPAGGAVMADGDPGAHITYTTLTEAQLAMAGVAGRRLDFDDAIQIALDELDSSLLEIDG